MNTLRCEAGANNELSAVKTRYILGVGKMSQGKSPSPQKTLLGKKVD